MGTGKLNFSNEYRGEIGRVLQGEPSDVLCTIFFFFFFFFSCSFLFSPSLLFLFSCSLSERCHVPFKRKKKKNFTATPWNRER